MISSGLLLYSPGKASVTCTRACVKRVRMTGLSGILNTLHIRHYIPSNTSKLCQYEHTCQLGDVMNVINQIYLYYLLNQNHCYNGTHAVCDCAQESKTLHEPALAIEKMWSSFMKVQSRAYTNVNRVFIVIVATAQTGQGCLKSSECFHSVIYF